MKKAIKETLVLSAIAAGALGLAVVAQEAHADQINGQHVTRVTQPDGTLSTNHAIGDNGLVWNNDGGEWYAEDGSAHGILAPDAVPTKTQTEQPTEVVPPKVLPEQQTPPRQVLPEQQTPEKLKEPKPVTQQTPPPKVLPTQKTPQPTETTEPTVEEIPTTGKTPSQVDGGKETTPTNKTDNSIHNVKETTPTNKEHNSNDAKKETTQTIKHENSNLAHAAVTQNSGVSAQHSAGSKGRSSGQTVKTVGKASEWKPSHLDRVSADAEGKAAGHGELPHTGDDAILTWAAGLFGIAAILIAATLALFNFKRYRKED